MWKTAVTHSCRVTCNRRLKFNPRVLVSGHRCLHKSLFAQRACISLAWGKQTEHLRRPRNVFVNRMVGQLNAADRKNQQGDQRLQDAKPSGLTECLPGPSGPGFQCNFAAGLEGRHSKHGVETAAWTVSPFQGWSGGGDIQPAVHTAGKHCACPPGITYDLMQKLGNPQGDAQGDGCKRPLAETVYPDQI